MRSFPIGSDLPSSLSNPMLIQFLFIASFFFLFFLFDLPLCDCFSKWFINSLLAVKSSSGTCQFQKLIIIKSKLNWTNCERYLMRLETKSTLIIMLNFICCTIFCRKNTSDLFLQQWLLPLLLMFFFFEIALGKSPSCVFSCSNFNLMSFVHLVTLYLFPPCFSMKRDFCEDEKNSRNQIFNFVLSSFDFRAFFFLESHLEVAWNFHISIKFILMNIIFLNKLAIKKYFLYFCQ